MTLDAAVTLARELAISAGVRGDVVSAERRGFRVVVDVGAAMAYVVRDDAGGRRLALVVDERGRITGAFDIEEAALGDRHHDMRWLPSYGPVR